MNKLVEEFGSIDVLTYQGVSNEVQSIPLCEMERFVRFCEARESKLQDKLKTAIESLEFYANIGNWFMVDHTDYENGHFPYSEIDCSDVGPVPTDCFLNPYGGKSAREALVKIKEST